MKDEYREGKEGEIARGRRKEERERKTRIYIREQHFRFLPRLYIYIFLFLEFY